MRSRLPSKAPGWLWHQSPVVFSWILYTHGSWLAIVAWFPAPKLFPIVYLQLPNARPSRWKCGIILVSCCISIPCHWLWLCFVIGFNFACSFKDSHWEPYSCMPVYPSIGQGLPGLWLLLLPSRQQSRVWYSSKLLCHRETAIKAPTGLGSWPLCLGPFLNLACSLYIHSTYRLCKSYKHFFIFELWF